MTADSPPQPWHLDKRIPVALMLGLAIQLITGIFLFGQQFERLENIEERVISNEIEIAASELRNNRLENRLTRIEAILERIDARMNRRDERQGLDEPR